MNTINLTQKRLIILLSLLFIFVYLFQYDPPVEAAVEGHELIHLTEPGLLGGVIKSWQMFFEITPCTYEILGWDNTSNLFFVAQCRTVESFHVLHGGEVRKIAESSVPFSLHKSEIPPWEYRDFLYAGDVRPLSAEKPTRRLYVRENGLVSPDGKSVAFVTQRIYSVQDVMVLHLEG